MEVTLDTRDTSKLILARIWPSGRKEVLKEYPATPSGAYRLTDFILEMLEMEPVIR